MNFLNRKKINFIGIKESKSIARLIEQQIEKWIVREQTLMFFPNQSEYTVWIERDPTLPHIWVTLKIMIGSRTWKSHQQGQTLQEAFDHAIERLRTTEHWGFSERVA